MLHSDEESQVDSTVLEQARKREAIKKMIAKAESFSTSYPLNFTLTFFDMLEGDFIGVITRKFLNDTIKVLFEGRGVQSPTFFYPACNLLSTAEWATCKSNQLVSCSVKWETLSFISPLQEEHSSPQGTKKESTSQYLSFLNNEETSEKIVARLNPPDQISKEMMQNFVDYVESRGIVWKKVSQVTIPSIKNRFPRHRPEFVVLGLFPKVRWFAVFLSIELNLHRLLSALSRSLQRVLQKWSSHVFRRQRRRE